MTRRDHFTCSEKIRSCVQPGFFAHVTSSFEAGWGGGRGNELSFQSGRFYRRENHVSSLPAISYDSNFVFPLTGNVRPTLKNIGVAGPEVSGNQSCALRACKPICQFHGAAAPKNGIGKIVGVLSFHRDSYDFRPIVTYWVIRRRSFHVANFDLFIIDWVRTIRKMETIFRNDLLLH